jgi:hypothetical protein
LYIQVLATKVNSCKSHLKVTDLNIEEENGQLIIHNEEGGIIKDARTIIYPGVGGDPWWEHTQLLV